MAGNFTVGNAVLAGNIGNKEWHFGPGINGGALDERTVTDGAISATSTTFTSATANFTTADNSRTAIVAMGSNGLHSGTYTSGITATGTAGQTCLLTSFNGGGSSATATLVLTGTNAIAASTPMGVTAAEAAIRVPQHPRRLAAVQPHAQARLQYQP